MGAGALTIRVRRGIDLVISDWCSSDPYVVVQMGDQTQRTRVIGSNCNPEWNEELTFSVSDPFLPIKLTVFDQDLLSEDDQMGDAEIDIKPYLQCLELDLWHIPIGTVVKTVHPNRSNCLAEESKIVSMEQGRILQDMNLRLRNVPKGEVEVQIEWHHLSQLTSSSSSSHHL